MLTQSAPLAKTVRQLRNDELNLSEYISEACGRVDRVDAEVQSLLPEPDRCGRLEVEAAELELRFPDPDRRPPLFGALVAVKDIFHVDGFVTRAGTGVPPELFAGHEAAVVTSLRDAGALILGKAVTTEFAYFEPGPTRNPHNLAHTPGGSSSGSAAAVAAGLCPLAVGTQTIGSVIRPAAFCGIVGFKPSFDRIPTAGLVYFSRSADHVGLFTQDVAGMRLAASVVCRDWQEVPAPAGLPVLGLPEGPYLRQTDPEGLAAFRQQIDRLANAGVTVCSVPALEDIERINHLHRRLIFAEFADEHASMYDQYTKLYRPRTAEIIEIGRTVTDDERAEAKASMARLRAELTDLMDAEGIDLWVCPAALGPAPEGIHATGDPAMNLPWTHAGMPAITLPAGLADNGLPLGLQLVARFGQDEMLLGWAELISKTGVLTGRR
ncbi:MAG: amidase [Caldilineae bacterium]|nr:amidase [Anaerolineae bacterium]MCB9155413.1 amidase [Caldilineae bacterium]